MRCSVILAALLLSFSAQAAECPERCAQLDWTAPQLNTDGSELTDLADYQVWRRCDAGTSEVVATVPAPQANPLPEDGGAYNDQTPLGERCWYSVTARNAVEASEPTGEVNKGFIPGQTFTEYTWAQGTSPPDPEPEPPDMLAIVVGAPSLRATNGTTDTVDLSSPTTFPSSIPVGAKVFIVHGKDTNGSYNTLPSGWTDHGDVSVAGPTAIGRLISKTWDGTEGSSVDFVTSNSDQFVAIPWYVTGWDTGVGVIIGTAATGSGASANPPAVTLSTDGDYMVMPVMVLDGGSITLTNPPTNYTLGDFEPSSGSSAITVAMAYRSMTGVTGAPSEDPSSFTLSSSDEWGTQTVALKASGGGVTGSLTKTLGAVTLSADGQVFLTGALSKTLGALTLASEADVLVQASLAKTLGALVLSASASGETEAIGSLNKTLGLLTLASDGSVLVAGSLARSLGLATLSSTGVAPLAGSLNKTLGLASLDSAATILVVGTLSKALGSVLLTASGGAPVIPGIGQRWHILSLRMPFGL